MSILINEVGDQVSIKFLVDEMEFVLSVVTFVIGIYSHNLQGRVLDFKLGFK